MSEARINFLNWRPDAEDTEHDGLTVANNVVHEPEGYKPTSLLTASAPFSTVEIGSILVSAGNTTLSCQARPIGSQGDVLAAWISNDSTAPSLHIGVNGITGTTSATGFPLQFATAYAGGATNAVGITAFDVCEYAGKILWTVEAHFKTDVATSTVTNVKAFAGYMDF